MSFFVVFVVWAGVALADPPKDGDPVGEITEATDSGGKAVTLKSLRGKWVVISTTADWLSTRLRIEPLVTWNKLAVEWPTVVFLGLDLTPPEGVASRKKTLIERELHRVRFVFVDAEKQQGPLFFEAVKVPSTTIVDPKGVVRYYREGYEPKQAEAELERLRGELGKLLGPPTPKAEPR